MLETPKLLGFKLMLCAITPFSAFIPRVSLINSSNFDNIYLLILLVKNIGICDKIGLY